MKKRIVSILTALALCLSLCPTWAFALEGGPEGPCKHGEHECRICPIEDLIAALPEEVTEDDADEVRSQLNEILDLWRELTEEEQDLLDLTHCEKLQNALDGANDPAPAIDGTIIVTTEAGKREPFESLEAAFQYADGVGSPATITLLDDVKAEEAGGSEGMPALMIASNEVTLVGGEHTVTITDMPIVVIGGTLILESGTINVPEGRAGAVMVAGYGGAGGTFIVNDGTISASGEYSGAVSVGEGGTFTVNGGTFSASGEFSAALLAARGSTVTISDGTFTGSNNAFAVMPDGISLFDMLEPGYAFYRVEENGGKTLLTPDMFIEDPEDPEKAFELLLDRTLIVEECGHPNGHSLIDRGDGYHMYRCPACHHVNGSPEAHVMDGNGVCTVCGARHVARVTFDGNEQLFSKVDMAWEAVQERTAHIHFLTDIASDDEPIQLSMKRGSDFSDTSASDITVTAETGCTVCWGVEIWAGVLTVGPGTFSGDIAVINDGTLNIIDGAELCYTGNGDYGANVNVYSTFNMSGGTVSYTGSDSEFGCALFCSGGNVTLTGGTFSGGVGKAIALSYPASGSDLLKLLGPGHAYYDEAGSLIEDMPDRFLKGTVKVAARECAEHTYDLFTDLGDGTHAQICTVCRRPDTPKPHTFDEDGHCECGGQRVATLTVDGRTSDHTSIERAWEAAKGQTAEIELLVSRELSECLVLNTPGSDITITMAEGIRLSAPYNALFAVNDGRLTLSSGTFEGSDVVQISGGTLTVRGSAELTGDVRGIIVFGGEVYVSASPTITAGWYEALWIANSAAVRLSGGTFTGGSDNNYAIRTDVRNNTAASLLADGCAYFDIGEDGSEEPVLDPFQANLSGTVRVKPGDTFQITQQPQGGTTPYGTSYPLSVTVEPAGDYTYQWYQDGKPVSGATEASYQVPAGAGNVGPLRVRDFFCRIVSSSGSSLTSETVRIEVTPRPVTAAITGTTTKVHDGTTAVPDGLTIELKDVLNGDNVTATAASCAYDSPDSGARTITATGIALDGADAGNYELTSDTASAAGIIEKARPTIAFKSGYDPGKTYDGQPIPAPAAADTVTVTGADLSNVTFTWSATPRNAGTYTLTASIQATENNAAAEDTLTVTISKAPLTITGATVTPKTYDTNTTATVSGVTFSGLVNSETLAIGTDYTATGAFDNANAGENKSVTGTVTFNDTDKMKNYSFSNGTFAATGTISKAPCSITTPPAAAEITYGQALSDSILSGGTGSVPGTFAWANGSTKPNAGTTRYEVTFTPDGTNYDTTTATVSVTVAKAAPTIAWGSTTQTVNYTGSEAAIAGPTVTLVDGESFGGTIVYSYSSSGPSGYAPGLPIDAGTYTVKASIAEQGNYTAAESGEMTLTISKVDYTWITTAGTSCKYGMTKTFDLAGLLPKGYELGTIATSDSNGIFDGEVTINGTTLTYKLVHDATKAGKAGTITVPVTSSTNYNAFDLAITVNVTDLQVPNLAADPIRVTYTGDPVPDSSISGTAKVDGKEIDGTWSFVSGQSITDVADSGTKLVTFTPDDTDLYGADTSTVIVTIGKAVPSLTLAPSSATLPNGGTVTLTLSGLPAGGSATVTCSDETISVTKGNGNAWTAELPVGGASYAFTASYAGDGNHDSASANCTVTVTDPTIAVTGVVLNKTSVTLTVGSSERLTATVAPANASDKNVTWTSSDPSVATVDADGKVTAVSTGTTTVTVTTTDGNKIATCTVTVRTSGGGSGSGSSGSSSGSSSSSGGSSGSGSGTSTPVTTTGQNSSASTTTTTAVPAVSIQGGSATTAVNTAMGNEIVKQAVTNKSEVVVIAPSVTGSVTKAEVSIPASTVSQIGDRTSASLTVSTPVADITIPNGGLGSLSDAGGTVSVTAEQKDGAIKLTITAGGKAVENVPGGVTLTVPVANTTPGTVAVLVHEDGTREVVRKSVAGDGSVTIPLDGSARLEIVDNGKHFTDVSSASWAADAVSFASARELFNGTAPDQFSPDLPMTRGMLAVVLHNLESNPAQALTGAFADINDGAWYAEGVAWAAANGIVSGYGEGRFGPDDSITREQLAVMLWRYAGSPAATDKELRFTDADEASGYALEALRWAVENGIINGVGGGLLDPGGPATRAQVAQMLMNYLNK